MRRSAMLWLMGCFFALPFCALASDPPTLKRNVLTAIRFDQFSSRLPQVDVQKALAEATSMIVEKDLAQQSGIEDYARRHTIAGKLDYFYRPITWEALHRNDDIDAKRAFIELLTGARSDFSTLADKAKCPSGKGLTLCVTGLAIFDVSGLQQADIQFAGAGKADLLRAFLHDVAEYSPRRFSLSFRGRARPSAQDGQIVDPGDFGRFVLYKYRIYDDEVKLGVTSKILPSEARSRAWIYNMPSHEENGWNYADNVVRMDQKLGEQLRLPVHFTSTRAQFDWNLFQLERLFGPYVLASDRELTQNALAINSDDIQAFAANFRNHDEVTLTFDFAINSLQEGRLERYPSDQNKWESVAACDVVFERLVISGKDASTARFEIRPR